MTRAILIIWVLLTATPLYADNRLRPNVGLLPAELPTEILLVDESQSPTTPGTALGASLATVLVGLGTGLGALQPYFRTGEASALREPSSLLGLGAAMVLFGLGPNVGDLLNGDALRFISHGGVRAVVAVVCMALTVLSSHPLGTLLSIFAGTAVASWAAVDTYASASAPERWAERENRARQAPLLRF